MTKKLSVKQLKELAQFKAKSATGKVATFKVEGEKAVNVDTAKSMSLDSIRRNWEIIIEETAEVAEEVVAQESSIEEVAEVVAEEVAPVIAEQEDAQEVEVDAPVQEVAEITVGSIVKLADSTVGKVIDVVGTLATVQTADDEIPAQLETLEMTDSEFKAEEPKKDTPKAQKPKRAKTEKADAPVVEIPSLEMILSEMTPTAKSFKLVDEIRIGGDLDLRITQYGEYITDVRVIKVAVNAEGEVTEEELYKSPKMSVKDSLEWMNFSPSEVKALTNEIRKIRKAYKEQREQATAQAQV